MNKKIFKKTIHAPSSLNEATEYGKSFSRGVRVSLGDSDLILISGTASIDQKGNTFAPDDFAAQAKKTFDNITTLLESEGASWHDVVKTRCYLKDMKYYEEFNRIRNWFYKEELKLKQFPASVGIQAVLCRPELLVEIEATAIVPSKVQP